MTFFELKYKRVKRITGISAQIRKNRTAISQRTLCFFTETGTLLRILRIITARIYLSDSGLSKKDAKKPQPQRRKVHKVLTVRHRNLEIRCKAVPGVLRYLQEIYQDVGGREQG